MYIIVFVMIFTSNFCRNYILPSFPLRSNKFPWGVTNEATSRSGNDANELRRVSFGGEYNVSGGVGFVFLGGSYSVEGGIGDGLLGNSYNVDGCVTGLDVS